LKTYTVGTKTQDEMTMISREPTTAKHFQIQDKKFAFFEKDPKSGTYRRRSTNKSSFQKLSFSFSIIKE
jgi:hypothetical protein